MKELRNVDLFPYNTIGLSVKADLMHQYDSPGEIVELAKKGFYKDKKFYILGGGSKVVFSKDFDGMILQPKFTNKEIETDNGDTVEIEVDAGHNWDQLVRWSAEQGLSGIENLAFIPGDVGAAPIHNIGAYGQDLAESFVSLQAIDLYTGEKLTFDKKDLGLRYRHSIFLEENMCQYLIISVRLRLSRDSKFDTNYHSRNPNESLQLWLEKVATPPYKPIDIANAVTELRKFKLPVVGEVGTFGSVFINPFVSSEKYAELSKRIPDLQSYPVNAMDYSKKEWDKIEPGTVVKIPAGRLLEELGWKGKWEGNVGTFDKHTLIVVTNFKATPKELIDFIEAMRESVKKEYDIVLENECLIVE